MCGLALDDNALLSAAKIKLVLHLPQVTDRQPKRDVSEGYSRFSSSRADASNSAAHSSVAGGVFALMVSSMDTNLNMRQAKSPAIEY